MAMMMMKVNKLADVFNDDVIVARNKPLNNEALMCLPEHSEASYAEMLSKHMCMTKCYELQVEIFYAIS